MAVITADRIGDLADRNIARAAAANVRPERVVIIDPCDPEWVIPWNPFLQAGDPVAIADGFVNAIDRATPSWGVQIDYDLRNISQALVITRQSPLEIERVFNDSQFRARVATHIADVRLRGYFCELEQLSDDQRHQRQMAVSNKLQSFIGNPRLRRILCGRGTINLRNLLDDPAAVLIVALRKDQLHGSGDVLGDLIIQAIWNTVLSRSTIPEAERVKSTLILDEGQNFAKGCLGEIITEGRRYGLRLVFAHQSQAQLDDKLRSIIRNVSAVQCVFNVGPVDAQELAKTMMPRSRTDAMDEILRLQVGETIVVRQGKYPVRVITPAVEPVDMSLVREFRHQSMEAHAQRCDDVDREINERWAIRDSRLGAPYTEVRHVRLPRTS
jgi:hypothetical protein